MSDPIHNLFLDSTRTAIVFNICQNQLEKQNEISGEQIHILMVAIGGVCAFDFCKQDPSQTIQFRNSNSNSDYQTFPISNSITLKVQFESTTNDQMQNFLVQRLC